MNETLWCRPELNQPVWLVWPTGHYFATNLGFVPYWFEQLKNNNEMTITTRSPKVGGSYDKVGLYA